MRARRDELGSSSCALTLLQRCLRLYEANGLLPQGNDAPLHCVCPNRETCWNDVPRPHHPAGVSAPWIGRRYAGRRICLVGMNLDHWGGLEAHWQVCADHRRSQERGELGKAGRFFATGALTYVAAVIASLESVSFDTRALPAPEQLAGLWDEIAFVEAVKCSPATRRSTPTAAMFASCPPLLLLEELAILEPRVVLVLGRGPQPRDAVRPLLDVRWGESPGAFERDTFTLNGRDKLTLLSCNHPSAPNRDYWRRSLDELASSLRAAPLAK